MGRAPISVHLQAVCQYINKEVEANRGTASLQTSVDHPLAIFEFESEPQVSLRRFLKQVDFVKDEEWVIAAILARRLMNRNKSEFSVFNVHCLMLTAAMVAIKLRREVRAVQATFAKQTGLDVNSLVEMESAFLTLTDWELEVTREEYIAFLPCIGLASRRSSNLSESSSSASSPVGGNLGRMLTMLKKSEVTA